MDGFLLELHFFPLIQDQVDQYGMKGIFKIVLMEKHKAVAVLCAIWFPVCYLQKFFLKETGDNPVCFVKKRTK